LYNLKSKSYLYILGVQLRVFSSRLLCGILVLLLI